MLADAAEVRSAVDAYLSACHGRLRSLTITEAGRLTGGYVSSGVELLEAAAVGQDDRLHTARFVLKRTWANEVLALRALQQVPDGRGLPTLVADGTDPTGPWVLVSFRAGTHPPDWLVVPAAVFDTLARVHAHDEHRADALRGIVTIDAAWMEQARARGPDRPGPLGIGPAG